MRNWFVAIILVGLALLGGACSGDPPSTALGFERGYELARAGYEWKTEPEEFYE